jgi:hypothetical protein
MTPHRLLAVVSLIVASTAVTLTRPPLVAQTDLDALLSSVLARRDDNWKKLQQYTLDEAQRVELNGPAGRRLWGEAREYTWFIREGFFIRSPTKVNGVAVPEPERRRAEDSFLERVKRRDREEVEQASHCDVPPCVQQEREAQAPTVTSVDDLLTQTRRPGFVEAAYFLRFKFEPGRYTLAGREVVDGHELLRVEYYPTRLFDHEQKDEERRNASGERDAGEDREAEMERLMNKVSLVTLWIDPRAQQIVKYTFQNLHLDFLPLSWLVRVNDLRAEMTMGQPFKDVWLPRDIRMRAAAMFAVGSVDVDYRVSYHDYKEATTSGRLIFPDFQ